MAFSHGSKASLRTGTAAAPTVLTDLSDYLDSVTQPRNRDTAETTTFKKTHKTYVGGLVDGTLSFEGQFDPVVDAILHDLLTAGEVDFEYAPQGHLTAGGVKYTGKLLLTSYEPSSDVGDANQFSGEAQISGVVTRGIIP